MTAKDLEKLSGLSTNCESLLRDMSRQSETIYRGDMRAIVAAYKEITKAQRRRHDAVGVPVCGGESADSGR